MPNIDPVNGNGAVVGVLAEGLGCLAIAQAGMDIFEGLNKARVGVRKYEHPQQMMGLPNYSSVDDIYGWKGTAALSFYKLSAGAVLAGNGVAVLTGYLAGATLYLTFAIKAFIELGIALKRLMDIWNAIKWQKEKNRIMGVLAKFDLDESSPARKLRNLETLFYQALQEAGEKALAATGWTLLVLGCPYYGLGLLVVTGLWKAGCYLYNNFFAKPSANYRNEVNDREPAVRVLAPV
jgi:hypothetical protein